MGEVRNFLCQVLPLDKAAHFFELYSCHVNGRRGIPPDCIEARAYRKLLELEEAILLWEEVQKESGTAAAGEDFSSTTQSLIKKMQEVGFPGTERVQVFHDDSELQNLLRFFLQVTELTHMKRTGWVRKGIRDPETIASHMFRMAVMAMLVENDDVGDKKILNGSAVILALVHDMAECIVGDITPEDNVSDEDKHNQEVEAMMTLVKNLPTGRLSLELFNAFERYEEQHPEDPMAHLTKDLDKFDMYMQAFEYEEKTKKAGSLQEFFNAFPIRTPVVSQWNVFLREQRSKSLNE